MAYIYIYISTFHILKDMRGYVWTQIGARFQYWSSTSQLRPAHKLPSSPRKSSEKLYSNPMPLKRAKVGVSRCLLAASIHSNTFTEETHCSTSTVTSGHVACELLYPEIYPEPETGTHSFLCLQFRTLIPI